MTSDCDANVRHVVTREALYQQLWQQPMIKLAAHYGLSDVGLAKICRKHGIPRPPVGFWAKKAAGHDVLVPPLPELDDESLQEVHIFRQQFFGDESTVGEQRAARITVQVGERLTHPHPLVIQARELLEARKPAPDGIVRAGDQCLQINVSVASRSRALRILDSLIKYWEATGGAVKIDPSDKSDGSMKFTKGADAVGVVLQEDTVRFERNPDQSRSWHNWEFKPSGRLLLQISGRYASQRRQRWGDGKKQRLENILGSFVGGLEESIAHECASRLDDECEERQKTKLAELREEELARTRRREQRRESLELSAANWKQSVDIRQYLAALLAKVDEGLWRPTDATTFAEWLDWARWYADFLDPTVPTPHREEFLRLPTKVNVAELDLTSRTRTLIAVLGVTDTDELSRFTRKEVYHADGGYGYGPWREIGRVLENLGYDVSQREQAY